MWTKGRLGFICYFNEIKTAEWDSLGLSVNNKYWKQFIKVCVQLYV